MQFRVIFSLQLHNDQKLKQSHQLTFIRGHPEKLLKFF